MSYLAVVIIPIIILGTYSYSLAKRFMLNESLQGLRESVRQVSDSLGYKLKQYEIAIRFVSYNDQVVQIINNTDASYFERYMDYREILDPLLSTVQSLNQDIESMVIYTENVNITERSMSIQSIERIKDRPWFDEVMADRQLHWVVEDDMLIGVSRFFEPFKLAPRNLLYTKLKYKNAFNMEIKNTKEYGLYVSDKNDRILFASNNIENSGLAGIEEEILSLPSGELDVRGEQCILLHSEIPGSGWMLHYITPVKALSIKAGKIVIVAVVVILACLVILIFIIRIFSYTMVKGISRLNRKMKLVEEGNLKIEVLSNSRDEIGELTNRFGNMLNNINKLIDEVYHSRIVQKEAELKALQAQINPHFLYNTLSLINWKVIQTGEFDISRIINNVSRFYRTTLNKGREHISVEDELANIRCYIEIQLAMHNNSFDVEYDIDEEIFKYSMINTVLQPIVENAIEHGIDMKRSGRGKLLIGGRLHTACIILEVLDNGPGIDDDKKASILTNDSKGYGLKNVQERIKIVFGNEYGLSINNWENGGTCVTVRIPKTL